MTQNQKPWWRATLLPEKLRASLERIDARLAEFLAAMDAGDQAEPPPSAAAAAPVRGSLAEKIDALRERQQCYQEAAACAEIGVEIYVPRPKKGSAEAGGRFGKHARVAAHPEMIAQRKTLVEHPFGSIKFWQEQRAFMMKGLEKVRGEFNLSALAYNMKRVINIVGMERLLEAVRRLVAAAARLLEALLEALSARWHREEAEWPLAA